MSRAIDDLVAEGYHPIISCEGAAEQVAAEILLGANMLVFPTDDIVEVTRKRKAVDIQDEFLGYDYDWPVCIIRLLDSRKERFRLGGLYAHRFPVVDVLTHPEMEVLAIINEGKWERWSKSGKKPSEFCKDDLGFGRRIKSTDFLMSYWNADSLAQAAIEYKRLSRISRGEICLADLLRVR